MLVKYKLCRGGGGRVEGLRVGPNGGVKPLGCHDKSHHIAKRNIISSARIVYVLHVCHKFNYFGALLWAFTSHQWTPLFVDTL